MPSGILSSRPSRAFTSWTWAPRTTLASRTSGSRRLLTGWKNTAEGRWTQRLYIIVFLLESVQHVLFAPETTHSILAFLSNLLSDQRIVCSRVFLRHASSVQAMLWWIGLARYVGILCVVVEISHRVIASVCLQVIPMSVEHEQALWNAKDDPAALAALTAEAKSALPKVSRSVYQLELDNHKSSFSKMSQSVYQIICSGWPYPRCVHLSSSISNDIPRPFNVSKHIQVHRVNSLRTQ